MGFIAYLTILATALAGLAGAPFWAAIVCGCLLALISIVEQQRLAARFAALGESYILTLAGLTSLGNGLVAGGAAYAFGLITGWACRLGMAGF